MSRDKEKQKEGGYKKENIKMVCVYLNEGMMMVVSWERFFSGASFWGSADSRGASP